MQASSDLHHFPFERECIGHLIIILCLALINIYVKLKFGLFLQAASN